MGPVDRQLLECVQRPCNVENGSEQSTHLLELLNVSCLHPGPRVVHNNVRPADAAPVRRNVDTALQVTRIHRHKRTEVTSPPHLAHVGNLQIRRNNRSVSLSLASSCLALYRAYWQLRNAFATLTSARAKQVRRIVGNAVTLPNSSKDELDNFKPERERHAKFVTPQLEGPAKEMSISPLPSNFCPIPTHQMLPLLGDANNDAIEEDQVRIGRAYFFARQQVRVLDPLQRCVRPKPIR